MTVYNNDNNILIWNLNNLKCILNIKDINIINRRGVLFSASFLNDNDNIFMQVIEATSLFIITLIVNLL